MSKRAFVVLALAVVLAGCSDPVRVEKANAIRLEAEGQYMATATAVSISRQQAEVGIAATATAIADHQQVMMATRSERIARQETVITWTGRFGALWVLAVLVAFCIVSIGGAVAAARKANLEARLVRLDRSTRTWPIMLDLRTGIMLDLETGERAKLGDVQQLDHRRLVISGQVRKVGLLAQSAEKIAKTTRDPRPADWLAAIAQAVPLLKEVKES